MELIGLQCKAIQSSEHLNEWEVRLSADTNRQMVGAPLGIIKIDGNVARFHPNRMFALATNLMLEVSTMMYRIEAMEQGRFKR